MKLTLEKKEVPAHPIPVVGLLPEKLHECIEVALADFAQAKKDKCEIHMSRWCSVDESGKVTVCFAGSVMINTLKAKPSDKLNETLFYKWDNVRLEAIDYVRNGNLVSAIKCLYEDEIFNLINLDVKGFKYYEDDATEWKKQIIEIQKALKALDL